MPAARSVEALAQSLSKGPSADELKDAVQKEIDDADQADADELDETGAVDPDRAAKEKDPKLEREYTFHLDWRAGPESKRWYGRFTTKILSIQEKLLVGQLRARMARGQPYDSLDPLTQELYLMLATFSVALTGRPEWAKDFGKIDDIRVLQEIYQEVVSHEATFLGQA